MPMPTNKTWFHFEAKGKRAEITIFDAIGAWGISAKDFHNELKALGAVDELEIQINSPGGEVFAGISIYNMLARHKARKTVVVHGIAASIASIIAMAGDEIIMPSNAMMMIHDPSGVVIGTSKDMRELAAALDKMKGSMVSIYASKSGKEREEIEEIMSEETWLNADEAVEMGFADRIEEPVKIAASFDLSKFKNAPAAAEASRAAPPRIAQSKENDMTEQEKAAAAEAAAKKEADEKAAAALAAAPPAAPPAETPEQIAARITADVKKRSSDIAAACALAGFPDKATAYINSEKTLTEVLAELQVLRASAQPEVSSRNNAIQNATASWDKAVAKVNERIPAR